MGYKNDNGHRTLHSYSLSPNELEEVYRKYGRPGEIAPGQPATKKRNRLDSALSAMNRKDKGVTPFNGKDEAEPDIT